MKGVLIRWAISALSLVVTAAVLPGIHVGSLWAALGAAALLGVVNAVLRPALIVLTLPINILTLGLFTLVINGLLLYMVANVIKGVEILGFGWAVLGALLLGLVSWALNGLVGDRGGVEAIELRRRRDGTWGA